MDTPSEPAATRDGRGTEHSIYEGRATVRLQDRIALVTAGGSGMGRASCLRFAEEGATVVVADIDEGAARSTVGEIESRGGTAVAYRIDVSKRDELEAMAAFVETEFGILHVLYNNAGIPGAGGVDLSDEEWDLAIDVNLKSAFFGTSVFIPLLEKAAGQASVIYTASTAALVGSAMGPLYCLTKGGVVQLMKALALAYGTKGIRFNAICPGPIDTPMLPRFFSRETNEEIERRVPEFVAAAVPMGRPGRPEEIAAAAAFLASDDSSFITGVPLPVDGGYLAR